MAMDELLPKFMGKIHAKYLTPVVTIMMTCVVMALVILFLDVEKIAKLASAFMVMMFIFVNACVIILRETSAQWYNPPYRSPLYPFVQLFGIISGIILLVFLGFVPFLAILAIFILGFVIYCFLVKTLRRTGVLGIMDIDRLCIYFIKGKTKRERPSRKGLQFNTENFRWKISV